MSEEQPAKEQKTASATSIVFHKVYVKDISFETRNPFELFTSEWVPTTRLELSQAVRKLEEDVYEIELTLTVTTKVNDKNAYLVEVKQAGIFTLRGFDDQSLEHRLEVYCPGVLYPYAASNVTELITKGGFPQLLLSPINFLQNYKNKLEARQQAQAQQGAEEQ